VIVIIIISLFPLYITVSVIIIYNTINIVFLSITAEKKLMTTIIDNLYHQKKKEKKTDAKQIITSFMAQ